MVNGKRMQAVMLSRHRKLIRQWTKLQQLFIRPLQRVYSFWLLGLLSHKAAVKPLTGPTASVAYNSAKLMKKFIRLVLYNCSNAQAPVSSNTIDN